MALPSNIPTSFVPHSAATARRFRGDLTGAFDFFAYLVLGIVFALALGVFLYGRMLSSSQAAKDAELAQAEAATDPVTVENFVRLRDRLTSSGKLLANHVAVSNFFSLLETLVPSTVRIATLHLSVSDGGAMKFEGTGVAKSFNALAAASTAFARDGRVKDAIFSNIVVSPKDSSVSFALSAALDSKLVLFTPTARDIAPAQAPAATSTTSI
jgi:hypothetical protein